MFLNKNDLYYIQTEPKHLLLKVICWIVSCAPEHHHHESERHRRQWQHTWVQPEQLRQQHSAERRRGGKTASDAVRHRQRHREQCAHYLQVSSTQLTLLSFTNLRLLVCFKHWQISYVQNWSVFENPGGTFSFLNFLLGLLRTRINRLSVCELAAMNWLCIGVLTSCWAQFPFSISTSSQLANLLDLMMIFVLF